MSKLAELLRKMGGGHLSPKQHHVTAILLAGGTGSRMEREDGTTKQMILLSGMPLIARTVQVFEQSKAVSEIVLVAREEEFDAYEEMKQTYGWTKVKKIVPGGGTRQDSAFAGFRSISDETELVLIHDGARCLVTEEMIERVAREALVHGAAIAAQRANATVKKVDAKGMIEETIDRDTVWLAQTPQAFATEVYRAAVYLTKSKGVFTATDDAMFVENVDLPVTVVDCGDENIKITTLRDLYVAEAILAEREQRRQQIEESTPEKREKNRAKRKEARKL